ncbi:MAG: aldo/keto reductase [Candidatus Caldarchaeum sp.]|nr:aldo/keto reductase [Candidatus Caldarchaeum sp.]
MEKKILGKTGEAIAAIGFGTWGIGGRETADYSMDDKAVEAIRYAVELGMNHIDTAEIYAAGHAEELVGEAVKIFPRDEVFIASKVWPSNLRYEDVLKSCRRSLERLRLKYLDLYMVHWPNPRIPIDETMKAMEKLVKDGLIRYIGVSNFDVPLLEKAMESLKSQEIVSNQVIYSLDERGIEKELLPFCERNKITVIAYTPLGKGKIAAEARMRTSRGKVLADIAARYGKTPNQVALNWVIYKPNVVTIPKSINKDHISENAGGAGWRLTEEDYELLSKTWKTPSA